MTTKTNITEGTIIHFVDGIDDSDGRILEVAADGRCLVAWDSEVKIWHDAEEVAEWAAKGFIEA